MESSPQQFRPEHNQSPRDQRRFRHATSHDLPRKNNLAELIGSENEENLLSLVIRLVETV